MERTHSAVPISGAAPGCSNDVSSASREARPACNESRTSVGASHFPPTDSDDVIDDALPNYLVVLCIAVPVAIVVLASVIVYVLQCSRRHRLNWYERSLIDDTARASRAQVKRIESEPCPSSLLLGDDEEGEDSSINSRQESTSTGGCGCVVPGVYSVLPGSDGVRRGSTYDPGNPCSFQTITRVTYVTIRTRSVDSQTSSPVGDPATEVPTRPARKPPHQDRVREDDEVTIPLSESTSQRKGVKSYGGCGETRHITTAHNAPVAERNVIAPDFPEVTQSRDSSSNATSGNLRDISFIGPFPNWADFLPVIHVDGSAAPSGSRSKRRRSEVINGSPGVTGSRAEEAKTRRVLQRHLKSAMGATQSGESSNTRQKPNQGVGVLEEGEKLPDKSLPSGVRKPSVQFDEPSMVKRSSLSSATDNECQGRRKSESSVTSLGADGRSVGCTGIGTGIASVFGGWGMGINFPGGSGGGASKTISGGAQGAERNTADDQFWVPPNILQKKRAQSLVPQLLETKNGSYLSKSYPSSSSSVNDDLPIVLPVEMPTEPAAVVQQQLPCGVGGGSGGPPLPQQRQRRASMHDALDHTKINASLYEAAALKTANANCDRLRSFDFPSIQEENLGAVNFSLFYDLEQTLLTVRLIQARDLVPRDFSGTADPFCRLCLLPNRKNQLQSRVHKKTLNPEFEEEFIFDVPVSDLASMSLEILMFDYDQFSHDECVGQIRYPLEQYNPPDLAVYWKGLSTYERKTEDECYGDLMFSLAYLPSAERLTVAIIKARKLRMLNEGNASPNPYVRISLVADGKRRKRKKTSTKRNTVNPIWNEALVFNVDKDLLNSIQVEFTVFNDNLLGNNDSLGDVIVGKDTSGEELAHWTDVLHLKNAMPRWHHIIQSQNVSG